MTKPEAVLTPETAAARLSELVDGALADRGTTPVAQAVFEAFQRFAAIPVADHDPDEDEDLLLAQFGTYGFRGRDEFSVDLTRQLSRLADEDDEDADDEMRQLRCTLYWPLSPETTTLGDGNLWSIDAGSDGFFAAARQLPGWAWALTTPREPEVAVVDDLV